LLFVKYEDLVCSPTPLLQALTNFSGVNLDESLADKDFNTGRIDFGLDEGSSPWHTKLYGKK